MSRPFSYNDENFTVISNILFVHYNIGTKLYNKGDIIGTVPPAIYDRLATYNYIGIISNKLNLSVSANCSIYVDANRNIITVSQISTSAYPPRLVWALFLLKDI